MHAEPHSHPSACHVIHANYSTQRSLGGAVRETISTKVEQVWFKFFVETFV